MIAEVRSYLRKRLPPSSRAFERRVRDVVAAIRENQAAPSRLHGISEALRSRLAELQLAQQVDTRSLGELTLAVEKTIQQTAETQRTLESWRHAQSQEAEIMAKALVHTERKLQAIEQAADKQGRSIDETLWSETFNDTISSSEWLRDKAFSPGRWAVGYPYLYVLYRVLNEIRPARILELGLGQSTRMIAQYASAHDDVQHVVVEHDEKWIDFFSRNYGLPDRTHILRLDWGSVTYKEAKDVRVYAGFAEALGGEQFDLISIDGPLGGDMKHYARIDVLGLLPHCLADSFVIMLDDYERDAESRTMHEMREALSDAGVGHRSCRYSGSKDLGLLCSTDLAFLCSM